MQPDVVSESMKDNETWNTCPECDRSWKDEKATPGLIHRTRVCARCTMKAEHGRPKGNRLH
jgi:nitrous oxide reductase accessory protein NosL